MEKKMGWILTALPIIGVISTFIFRYSIRIWMLGKAKYFSIPDVYKRQGLSQASGVYFKVVDSDDWVDEEALMKILNKVKEFVRTESVVDMIISNYVYEKVGMEHKKVIHYRNVLPQNEVFRWDDIGSFHLDQYILMHSVIYRTEMLKLCQLKLPKHTFYVDNIYVYYPLPHVRTLYYMDVDFYRYFIAVSYTHLDVYKRQS